MTDFYYPPSGPAPPPIGDPSHIHLASTHPGTQAWDTHTSFDPQQLPPAQGASCRTRMAQGKGFRQRLGETGGIPRAESQQAAPF